MKHVTRNIGFAVGYIFITLVLISLMFISLMLFASCDILRTSPFEVASWSPGEGRWENPQEISVSLVFSHDPDTNSVERYFSLYEDGTKVKGDCAWDGKRMTFIPAAPLEKNRDYSISLSTDSFDTKNLSLERAFEGRFTTKPSEDRPVMVTFFPAMNGIISDPCTQIELAFSFPVQLDSLYANVSFSPSMSGIWELEGDNAVFTPSEPWTHGKRYEIRVSSSLTGSNGMDMGKDFLSIFIVGEDHEKPELSALWRVTENGDEEILELDDIGSFIENSGWEKGDKMRFEFSKPVDSISVVNCISLEGATQLVCETLPGFSSELIFSFDKAPVYDSRFSLTLKPGVKDESGNESEEKYLYRIHCNGVYSKPPILIGIRMPMAPGNVDPELQTYALGDIFEDFPINDGEDRYLYTVETPTWIECYFDTATDADINLFSVMELFRITTSNNVLVFSPRSVSGADFTITQSAAGWETYVRVEIKGLLTNTVNSGLVHFDIAPGLRDSIGNRSEERFQITLVK